MKQILIMKFLGRKFQIITDVPSVSIGCLHPKNF